MAFDAFDGATAAVDVTIGTEAGTSTKCIWGSVETDIQTDLFAYQTFCAGAWENVREGISRMLFVLLGYVGGGIAYSKPGSLRGLASDVLMMIQYDTGCTITFTPKVSRDRNVQTTGASARAVEGRADGEPVIVWVVA